MRTLYGLAYSPWTDRARWALEHHRLAYRYHEHVPLLGEPLLRRAARGGGGGPVTVPLLVDDGAVLRSSTEIARHADRIGDGTKLFTHPEGPEDPTAPWESLAQRVMDGGRACMMQVLAQSREAQAESLPAFLPGAVRTLLAPSAALGLAFIRKKHRVREDRDAVVEDTLRPALREVRAALDGRKHLVGDAFGWADIAVAGALHVVRPHARAFVGPAMREAWTVHPLAEEFEDLLRWRDALVRAHRPAARA